MQKDLIDSGELEDKDKGIQGRRCKFLIKKDNGLLSRNMLVSVCLWLQMCLLTKKKSILISKWPEDELKTIVKKLLGTKRTFVVAW